jgi:N4-gp56 family major capsid protein
MAVDTFIPEVWHASLMTALRDSYVFASLVNRDYEGDIAESGDTVHIGALSDVTIKNYVKNTTVIAPDTLATTDQTMVIDQSKFFAFEVDDIDARQVKNSGDLLNKAALSAADGLGQNLDTFVSGLMVAGASNVIAPADVSTPDQAYKVLVVVKVKCDRAKMPVEGRFLVISPEFHGLLLQDNRFIDVSRYGSSEPILRGEVGRVLGFRVIVSNRIPQGTAGTAPEVSNFLIAGHQIATTLAEQIRKVEAYRPQDSFSDAIKGLHLFGGKVVRGEALVVQDIDVTL